MEPSAKRTEQEKLMKSKDGLGILVSKEAAAGGFNPPSHLGLPEEDSLLPPRLLASVHILPSLYCSLEVDLVMELNTI